MGFDPFKEKGMALEKQIKSWSKLNVKPFDKFAVHPHTRTRVILMNGIEVEAALFSHQFDRHADNMDLKRNLAMVRRIEAQQQKMVNWLIPANQNPLETTIGYEQLAVDLTAALAKTESNPYVKQVLDFALLEDFDHLYRYSNLLRRTDNEEAERLTGQYTEITVGRPTVVQHRHPYDSLRRHYDKASCDPATCMHVLTITAAEQQTMNYYMNFGPTIADETGRSLYQEIGQMEEQHVSQYEMLMDPTESWFQRLVAHEYNECWLYYSLARQEPDEYIRSIWQEHLDMEVEHLKAAAEMMKTYEKRDPREMFPKEMPKPLELESNIDYIRDILTSQVNLTAKDGDIVPVSSLSQDDRYFRFREMVNAEVPSEKVIEQSMQQFGKDYRLELRGEHPIPEYRRREAVGAR